MVNIRENDYFKNKKIIVVGFGVLRSETGLLDFWGGRARLNEGVILIYMI